jgi:hypothetical protein
VAAVLTATTDAGYPTYVLNQNRGFLFEFLPVPSTDTLVNGPRLAALVDQTRAETGAERVDGPVCVRHVPGVAHLGEPFSLAVASEALARGRGLACPFADRFAGTVPDAQGP